MFNADVKEFTAYKGKLFLYSLVKFLFDLLRDFFKE